MFCMCLHAARQGENPDFAHKCQPRGSMIRFVQCQQGICLRENSHVFTSKGTGSQVGSQAWDASSQEPHALFAWFSTYVSPKQSGSQRSLQERLVAWAVIIWPRYEPGSVVLCTCIVTNLKVCVCVCIYIYIFFFDTVNISASPLQGPAFSDYIKSDWKNWIRIRMQKQTTYENRKTKCCHGPVQFPGFSENEVSSTFWLQKCFLENMQVSGTWGSPNLHTPKKTMILISKVHKTQNRIKHAYTVKKLNDFDIKSAQNLYILKKSMLLISQVHKTCIYPSNQWFSFGQCTELAFTQKQKVKHLRI